MEESQYDRRRAIESFQILNEIVGDLVVGTRNLGVYETHSVQPVLTPEYRVAVTRLTVFHVVITLSKVIEFYSR